MDYKLLYKKYKSKYKNLQKSGSNIQRSNSNPNSLTQYNQKPKIKRTRSLPILLDKDITNNETRDSDLEDDDLYDEARDTEYFSYIDIDHPVDPYTIRPRDERSLLGSNYLDIPSDTNTFHPLKGSQKIKEISRGF